MAKAHNVKHKFGRRVEGCPKCAALGPKRAKAARTTASVAESGGMVTLTYEQLQALMSGQSNAAADMIEKLVIGLKKPDPETQARLDKEKARLAEKRRLRQIEIQTAAESLRIAQATCSHLKENGHSAKQLGQVYSDGFYHPRCCRCRKEFALVKQAPGAA